MAQREKRLRRKERVTEARGGAIVNFGHRLAACFATGNWPRAVGGVEEAAQILHQCFPDALPMEVAQMAFLLEQVRGQCGKPTPSPSSVIVTLHLLASGRMAPDLLTRLPPNLHEEVRPFARPIDATWLEGMQATLSRLGKTTEETQ